MGCASSAASPAASEPANKDAGAGLAGRQRRKLSVAPGHVGDISLDAPGEAVKDTDTSFTLSELELVAKGRLQHAVLSRKGFVPYSKKKVNQDRPVLKYAVGDNGDVSMFGVMDGHGEFGHEVSSFVQTNLPLYLGKEVNTILQEPQTGIAQAVGALCDQLTKTGINCSFSGTTCVFGVKVKDTLYVANIGDSRCVLGRKIDGQIRSHDLSKDHKPESPIEQARIVAAGGRVETLPGPPGEDCGPFRVWLAEVDVPGLAMSRSIGDYISQQVGVISDPEIMEHQCADEDMFCIFASDGVWEFMSSDQAVELVWEHRSNLQLAAQRLVEESTKRWKQEEEVIDDITCLIIQFNPFN